MIRTVETRVLVLRNGAQFSELQFAPGSAPKIRCRDDAAIKMSMTGQFRPNPAVDWLSDELQAVLVIDGVQHPVGIFLPAAVEEKEENGLTTFSVEAYDRCWRVQTEFHDAKTEFAAGSVYLTNVENILTLAGIGSVMATASSAVLPAGRVYIGETDLLEMANEMLAEINYKALWFTASGAAVLEPYVEPTVDNIQHRLDGDDVKSLLLPAINRKTDVFDAPNVFTCICATPDRSSVMQATAVNNSPLSPYSVIRRRRRIQKIVQVKSIADQAALEAYAERLRDESMLRGETIEVETALLPGFGVADVVGVHYGNFAALCVDKSWEMDFRPGGIMRHSMERVITNYEQ